MKNNIIQRKIHQFEEIDITPEDNNDPSNDSNDDKLFQELQTDQVKEEIQLPAAVQESPNKISLLKQPLDTIKEEKTEEINKEIEESSKIEDSKQQSTLPDGNPLDSSIVIMKDKINTDRRCIIEENQELIDHLVDLKDGSKSVQLTEVARLITFKESTDRNSPQNVSSQA
jgi:hypothetical protein